MTLGELLLEMRRHVGPHVRDRRQARLEQALRARGILGPGETVDRLPPERLSAPAPDGVREWVLQTPSPLPPLPLLPSSRRERLMRRVVRPFVRAPYTTGLLVVTVVTATLWRAGVRWRDTGSDRLPHVVAVAALPLLGYGLVIGGGWAADLPPGPWWLRWPVLVLLGNAAATFALVCLAPLVALHHWARHGIK
jgi:hypothetical protein